MFFSRHQPAALDMLQNKLVRVKDGSRNPSTLKKDLFATVVNEKRLFQNFVSDIWQGSRVRPWNWVIITAQMSRKIVIKYDYLQSWESSSNTALLEFGLAKSDLRQSSWPKVKFKEDFLNTFHFNLTFFQDLFKRWINNKLKSYISHLYFTFSIIFYSTLL